MFLSEFPGLVTVTVNNMALRLFHWYSFVCFGMSSSCLSSNVNLF